MKTVESVEQQIFVLERLIAKSNKVEYALINKVKKLKAELPSLKYNRFLGR